MEAFCVPRFVVSGVHGILWEEYWTNLVQVGQRCFFKKAKHSKATTNLAKLVQVGLLGTNLVQVDPVHLVPPYSTHS